MNWNANDDLELMRAAKALLKRVKWDPTVGARDADGNRIEAIWPAASYSLVGALTHSTGDDKCIARVVVGHLGSMGLTAPTPLNHWEKAPGRTLDEVVELLDRGIAKKEREL